jgi:hypothetical protein
MTQDSTTFERNKRNSAYQSSNKKAPPHWQHDDRLFEAAKNDSPYITIPPAGTRRDAEQNSKNSSVPARRFVQKRDDETISSSQMSSLSVMKQAYTASGVSQNSKEVSADKRRPDLFQDTPLAVRTPQNDANVKTYSRQSANPHAAEYRVEGYHKDNDVKSNHQRQTQNNDKNKQKEKNPPRSDNKPIRNETLQARYFTRNTTSTAQTRDVNQESKDISDQGNTGNSTASPIATAARSDARHCRMATTKRPMTVERKWVPKASAE